MAEIIKIFDTNTKLSGRFQSVSLEWYFPINESSNKPQRILQIPSQNNLKIKFSLLIVTLVIVIIQTYLALSGHTSATEKLLACLVITCLSAMSLYFYLIETKISDISAFLNGLIQFDRIYGKKSKRLLHNPFKELLSIYFSYLAIISSDLVPLGFVFGLHWNNPWKISLAGYWLIFKSTGVTSCPHVGIVISILSKVLVCSFNYCVWAIGIGPSVFTVAIIHNLSVAILLDNLREFQRLITACKPATLASTMKSCKMFRQIQLLTSMLNAFQKGPLILVIIVGATIATAFSMAALIETQLSDIACFIILLYMVLGCLTMTVVIIGQISLVYINTQEIKQIIKHRLNTQFKHEYRWEAKLYRSGPPLKVMISSTNFVDRLSPLNMLQFAVNLCANILLIE